MAKGNFVISYNNYWQGLVAESFDYAWVLYKDSLLVIFPLLIIPFLQSREESLSIETENEAEAET
jgi:hypothetical protein